MHLFSVIVLRTNDTARYLSVENRVILMYSADADV